jgi:predicted Kef-type K+ transport protein
VHHTELIATIAVGLTAALVGGLVAVRLRMPSIVGYLLAGIAVGPFTSGFVADLELAPPAVAGPLGGTQSAADGHLLASLALTLGKVVVFVALMLVVGTRVIPSLLSYVERTGSRELFILLTTGRARRRCRCRRGR